MAKYQFTPHVIEPSAGADRFTLAVLCEAYTEEQVPDAKGNLETRIVMRFHPRLAPIKVAVFPLVNKDGMPEKAIELYRRTEAVLQRRLRRQGGGRPPLPPAGRGRHPVLRHHRRRDDARTTPSRSATGTRCKQRRIPMAQVRDEVMKALTPGA